MIVVGEAARAAGRRIDVPIQNGTRLAGKTDWLDSGKDALLSPNVFLVDLPPGASSTRTSIARTSSSSS